MNLKKVFLICFGILYSSHSYCSAEPLIQPVTNLQPFSKAEDELGEPFSIDAQIPTRELADKDSLLQKSVAEVFTQRLFRRIIADWLPCKDFVSTNLRLSRDRMTNFTFPDNRKISVKNDVAYLPIKIGKNELIIAQGANNIAFTGLNPNAGVDQDEASVKHILCEFMRGYFQDAPAEKDLEVQKDNNLYTLWLKKDGLSPTSHAILAKVSPSYIYFKYLVYGWDEPRPPYIQPDKWFDSTKEISSTRVDDARPLTEEDIKAFSLSRAELKSSLAQYFPWSVTTQEEKELNEERYESALLTLKRILNPQFVPCPDFVEKYAITRKVQEDDAEVNTISIPLRIGADGSMALVISIVNNKIYVLRVAPRENQYVDNADAEVTFHKFLSRYFRTAPKRENIKVTEYEDDNAYTFRIRNEPNTSFKIAQGKIYQRSFLAVIELPKQ